MKYLGERMVKLGQLQVGKWDIRNERRGNCARLRKSIQAKGIIEPLLVQQKDGRLILLDGHRRYRIAQELGLKRVRVLIVEGSEDELKELVAVRHAIPELYNLLVKARLARLYRNSGMKLEEIAALLGYTTGYISDLVNIWSLGNGVVQALEKGKITVAHARLLLRLETARREELLTQILEKGLKVNQAKALIEGRSVVSWEEFQGALPPGVSAARVNGCIELRMEFRTLDELREQLRNLASALRGAKELEAEPCRV
jgi:ParB family chromosome partitioning protein